VPTANTLVRWVDGNAFASIVQARPCPTFGRPVRAPVDQRRRLLAFPLRTKIAFASLAGHETSRFPRKDHPHVPGSPTTPGRPGTHARAPVRVVFRDLKRVGTQNSISFAAQWLACALPCRRFAVTLAGANARLGSRWFRYAYLVEDLHPLLTAGLPAHSG
jgi:hypothetical protein